MRAALLRPRGTAESRERERERRDRPAHRPQQVCRAEQKARLAGCLAQRLWSMAGHRSWHEHDPLVAAARAWAGIARGRGFRPLPPLLLLPTPALPTSFSLSDPTQAARVLLCVGGESSQGRCWPSVYPHVSASSSCCRWSSSPAMAAPQRMAGWRVVLLLLTSIGAYGWVTPCMARRRAKPARRISAIP